MPRPSTSAEQMHNLLHKHNGTASPGIHPKRRALLSILQSQRPTTGRDDHELYGFLRLRGVL